MESLLSFFRMHWEQEPKMRNLFISKGGILRFMESPLSLFRMHWDHELPGGCSAGVLACECTGRPARCSCGRRDAAATRSRDGCDTRFMESLHGFDAVHWHHEPAGPRPRRRPLHRGQAAPIEDEDENDDDDRRDVSWKALFRFFACIWTTNRGSSRRRTESADKADALQTLRAV